MDLSGSLILFSVVSPKFVEEQPQIPATAGRLSTAFAA
jgi:hypothetical protein